MPLVPNQSELCIDCWWQTARTGVVAAGGGAAAGTVAGPVGTVMGATIGLGIDYSVGIFI